jgi:hypothetical protein
MVTTQLRGRITENGDLEVDLPASLPPGEVQVTLEVSRDEDLLGNRVAIPREQRPWTDEELAELMRVEPKTGAEIVEWLQKEGGWEDKGITSGAEWVEELRRKRREEKGW